MIVLDVDRKCGQRRKINALSTPTKASDQYINETVVSSEILICGSDHEITVACGGPMAHCHCLDNLGIFYWVLVFFVCFLVDE